MAKRIIQDIIPKKDFLERKRPSPPVTSPPPKKEIISLKDTWVVEKEMEAEDIKRREEVILSDTFDVPKRTRVRVIFISCVAILVISLGFIVVNALSSVKIKITPAQKFADIDIILKAKRDSADPDILRFKTVDIKTEEFTYSGKATEVRNLSEKASGKIVIYNNFSAASQTLVGDEVNSGKQTRFMTPDGKIFRIHKTVSIPGKVGELPGSIEVTVYADKPGEGYNIGLSDFTLPGFEGKPQYKTIYARSKTEMRGGFIGSAVTVSPNNVLEAREALERKAEEYVLGAMAKQTPPEFIFYKEAMQISVEENEDNVKPGERVMWQGGEFSYKGQGRVLGFLLPKDKLAENIINELGLKDLDKESNIANIESLTFKLLSLGEDGGEISFSLSGRGHFVSNIDHGMITQDLMKKRRGDILAIFKDYPNIEKAEVIFQPSWWHYIPPNSSRIKLEEVLYEENQ
ncbi:MAG TPA: hypothetical protein VJJ73_01305 [Candidatus Paceibacterota bacterium]